MIQPNSEAEQAGLLQRFEDRSNEVLQDKRKVLAGMIGILGLLQVQTLALHSVEPRDEQGAQVVAESDCDIIICDPSTTPTVELTAAPTSETTVTVPTTLAETTTTTEVTSTTVSATTTTTAPAPTTTTTLAVEAPRAMMVQETVAAPLQPETAASIEAMRLSPEGYQNFLDSIDTSLTEYAHQHPEFDPARNGFNHSRKTEWVTIHHTAMYANAGGEDPSRPIGDPDPRTLIDFMATRGNTDTPPEHKCCAVQFFNDRNGKMWQFTSRSTKVRHDYGYEEISVGLETEGIDEQFTTAQFENIVYWSIAILNAEGLLQDDQPLARKMRGHEETRDEYNATSGHRQSEKQDGDPAIMNKLREKTTEFLNANPGVLETPVTIQ